ncbi:MAG: hypothetical protein ACXWT4_16045 [Methylobacter sp.]
MEGFSFRSISWLIVSVIVLIFAEYWLKFKPVRVRRRNMIANGDLHSEVKETGNTVDLSSAKPSPKEEG